MTIRRLLVPALALAAAAACAKKVPAPELEEAAPPAPVAKVAPAAPEQAPVSEVAVAPKQCSSIDVRFEFDQAVLPSSEQDRLAELASCLRSSPQVAVRIEGNADDRGTDEYNLHLAQKRADAVERYLATLGVPKGRFTVVSFGEERPLCQEQSEDCWAKNRRAAIGVQ